MNIKSIITAAIALLISTACSGGAKQEKVMNKDGKSLVVFFSHAGDNYIATLVRISMLATISMLIIIVRCSTLQKYTSAITV